MSSPRAIEPAGPPGLPPAFYVYCIGERGILAPLLREVARPEPIEPGADLALAAAGRLGALFSTVPTAAYDEESLPARLSDPEWAAVRGMRHQRVVEHFARRAAVVPLRFGTLFLQRRRIAAMLADRAAELEALLERLRDRDEWSVSLSCQREQLLAGLDAVNPRLREAAARAAQASPGQAFLLRKKLDGFRAEEARGEAARAAREVEEMLGTVSDATARLRLLKVLEAEEGTPVARLAFLVARAEFGRFREAAEDLASRYAPLGFRLALTGPWPAYSFAGESTPPSSH